MSEQAEPSAVSDSITQWGVESPDGGVWTYHDGVIARIVSREQQKPVLRRTVTTTPWEVDADNVGYVPEPSNPPAPEHGPDWFDSLPGEPPSCACGFNGTPEECAASRVIAPEGSGS